MKKQSGAHLFFKLNEFIFQVNCICPTGWTEYNESCYLLVNNQVSMVDAQTYCKSKGGEVVSINRQDELEFINMFATTLLSSYGVIWVFHNLKI